MFALLVYALGIGVFGPAAAIVVAVLGRKAASSLWASRGRSL